LAQTSTAPAQEDVKKDGPQLGIYGFDETGMDKSVRPSDDFYLFANGTWAKNTEIPADKSNYGILQPLMICRKTA
jgi:putative endopeptidase